MKLLRGTMRMLTILFLLMMKGMDGPPLTEYLNTGQEVNINARAGENKLLVTKDKSAQKDILSFQWFFRKGNANEVTYCQDMSGDPERYSVNPLYSSKVEWCNATSILLKNISSHDEGYYRLYVLKNHVGKAENFVIFLSVSAPDNHGSYWGLYLFFLIIPFGLLAIYILYRKNILPCAPKQAVKEVVPNSQLSAQHDTNPASSIVTETEVVFNQMQQGGKLDLRKTDSSFFYNKTLENKAVHTVNKMSS